MEDLVLTKEADRNRQKLVQVSFVRCALLAKKSLRLVPVNSSDYLVFLLYEQKAYNIGSRACKAWADSEGGKVPIEDVTSGSTLPLKPHEIAAASAKVEHLLGGPQGKENFAALDGYMMSQLNPLASNIIKECLPQGLEVPFPAIVS